jgi:hypothetical protein
LDAIDFPPNSLPLSARPANRKSPFYVGGEV